MLPDAVRKALEEHLEGESVGSITRISQPGTCECAAMTHVSAGICGD
jgi:hypothetical protein